jgi:homoserine O-acetyltransferase
LGHITYLSDEGMRTKFGRELREGTPNFNFNFDTEFQVESYLRHQGKRLRGPLRCQYLSADHQDARLFRSGGDFDQDLSAAFHRTQARFLVISFTSDWRFAPARSREIVRALVRAGREVSYAKLPRSTATTLF